VASQTKRLVRGENASQTPHNHKQARRVIRPHPAHYPTSNYSSPQDRAVPQPACTAK